LVHKEMASPVYATWYIRRWHLLFMQLGT